MPYPLAIIVMVAMLAAGYYYIRFVTHLFMRALTTVKARGYKSPALLTAAGVVVFALPFVSTLAILGCGGHGQAGRRARDAQARREDRGRDCRRDLAPAPVNCGGA